MSRMSLLILLRNTYLLAHLLGSFALYSVTQHLLLAHLLGSFALYPIVETVLQFIPTASCTGPSLTLQVIRYPTVGGRYMQTTQEPSKYVPVTIHHLYLQ